MAILLLLGLRAGRLLGCLCCRCCSARLLGLHGGCALLGRLARGLGVCERLLGSLRGGVRILLVLLELLLRLLELGLHALGGCELVEVLADDEVVAVDEGERLGEAAGGEEHGDDAAVYARELVEGNAALVAALLLCGELCLDLGDAPVELGDLLLEAALLGKGAVVGGCSGNREANEDFVVVSLAPSATRIIYELGAQNSLKGCTSYCSTAPEDSIEVVSDILTPNIEKIISLKPNLVVATAMLV